MRRLRHHPAIVVFGGMLGSTLFDRVVTPAPFVAFGRGIAARRR